MNYFHDSPNLAVRAEHLTKEFTRRTSFFSTKQKIKAVNDVNIEIKKGEAVAFLGPNGAGKSTTIKLLCGILKPTSGNSWVLGERSGSRTANKRLGLVFGTRSSLWMFMTVRQSLELIAEIYYLTGREKHKRIEFLSELFEIKQFLNHIASSLSLGERMLCEIVASLLHRPAVLLADEPTIGLDVIAKARFRDLLHRWRKEENATLLLTSHDCSDVEALCDRIVLIDKGQIHYDGTLQEFKSKLSSTRYIKLVLSHPIPSNKHRLGSEAVLIEETSLIQKYRIDIAKMPVSNIIADLFNHHKEAIVDISIEPITLEMALSHLFAKPS